MVEIATPAVELHVVAGAERSQAWWLDDEGRTLATVEFAVC